MKRSLACLSVVAVLISAFVTTAASAGGACKPTKPATPQSVSSNAEDAPKEKVIRVTDKATESKPVVIEYSHGPGLGDQGGGAQIGDPSATMFVEDAKFFNFQLATTSSAVVSARIEWGTPSPSDIDLRLYGSGGQELDKSASYNPWSGGPLTPVFGGDDAMGMEQLLDIGMPRCYGFTIESRPSYSPGEDAVTLKVWLD